MRMVGTIVDAGVQTARQHAAVIPVDWRPGDGLGAVRAVIAGGTVSRIGNRPGGVALVIVPTGRQQVPGRCVDGVPAGQ